MRRLITNARLVDGTGAPAREGELLIEDGVIAELGGASLEADEVLDVEGMVVAPGFIDMHSHSDFTLPATPLAEAKVLQGITTEVVGNCGLGLAPANPRVEKMYRQYAPLFFGEEAEACSATVADYRDRLHDIAVSVNLATLVPHGNIRCAVMGLDERAPTASELDRMRELVDQAMRDGAFGLSTGLVYPPGIFAETEEVIELAKVVAPHGGLYATHMRDEGVRLLPAVREAIQIGEEANVSVQISHHKAAGQPNWGKVKKSLALLDEARARGLSVHSDVYPYTAASSVLAALALPAWAFEGSHEELMRRMRDPETRARIAHDVKERVMSLMKLPGPLDLIPKRWILPLVLKKMSEIVVVSSVKRQHQFEGKSLRELMKIRRQSLFDTILDLLLEEDVAVVAILHMMNEDDVRTVMRHEATMIGTDGFPMKHGKPHPRTFGTFPRVLGRYVREHGVLTLEQAVHRMTGMTARKLGLEERGRLEVGCVADLVVFEPDAVLDHATYEEPHQPPSGIPHVFVNGEHTVKNGEHTGTRAGRVLSR